jgi:hypothetical protein
MDKRLRVESSGNYVQNGIRFVVWEFMMKSQCRLLIKMEEYNICFECFDNLLTNPSRLTARFGGLCIRQLLVENCI